MATMTAKSHGGWLLLRLLAAALFLLLLGQLPTQLPDVRDVELCSHALASHGEAAERALDDVKGCKPEHLRVKLCPPGSQYGLTVVAWCQQPGAEVCPGLYLTIAGRMKTAFYRPCHQWRTCR